MDILWWLLDNCTNFLLDLLQIKQFIQPVCDIPFESVSFIQKFLLKRIKDGHTFVQETSELWKTRCKLTSCPIVYSWFFKTALSDKIGKLALYDTIFHSFHPDKQNLAQLVVVKSYTYSRLVIGYGPDKGATVTVQWCDERKAFTLLFGALGNTKNAHGLLREQMEAHLNRHRDLPFILQLLSETYQPLLSVSKLPTVPQMGVHNNVSLLMQ